LLPELLSRASDMPVLEVQEGMLLRQNTVLLCPPNAELTMTGSTFHVRPTSKHFGWPRSITIFLRSLAAAVGNRVVAVILSGMEADGSAALMAVKASGGRILVQADAPYKSMPRNAIATGLADLVLPVTQIAEQLVTIARKFTPA
jgi:two-component system CheB/CheR fusion protein